MDDLQLKTLIKQLSLTYFHQPYLGKAAFNNRLRTTGGRYLPGHRKIEINPKYLIELGMDELIGIIKHELCHYHLHITGENYRDRDASFQRFLKQVGAPKHCQPLPSVQKKPKIYYSCTQCGQHYIRKKKIDLKRYRCGACRGKLKQLNKKESPMEA